MKNTVEDRENIYLIPNHQFAYRILQTVCSSTLERQDGYKQGNLNLGANIHGRHT